MDTDDEWIVQRTGIHERRKIDPSKGERATTLSTQAVNNALASAGVSASDLDMVICGTVSAEMVCPSTACQVITRSAPTGPGRSTSRRRAAGSSTR